MINSTDFTKSEQYTLSIRLSTDGFSFSIFDPTHEGELPVERWKTDPSVSLTANLKRFLQEYQELKNPFKAVNIIIDTDRYLFIPLELFEDDDIETLFYHSHPQRDNEIINYHIFNSANLVVAFAADKSAQNTLKEIFSNARFVAGVVPAFEHFNGRSRLGNTEKLYVSLHKKRLDIFAFDRGKLLMANSFKASETEDMLYYILFAWKTLGLDQTRDELHLTGENKRREQLTRQLKGFIKQVFILPADKDIDLQTITECV